MTERYSIIIHPYDPVIKRFKIWKNELFLKIGDYRSRSSLAHITILEFEATGKEVLYVIEKLVKIAEREISFDVVFNKIVYTETSNSILALPSKDGNEFFKPLLKKIRKQIKGDHNRSSAHLSIGRELTTEHLEKCKDLFPNVEFDFHCGQLALRKLNKKVGQFEIVEIFRFSGKPPKSKTVQLSLF